MDIEQRAKELAENETLEEKSTEIITASNSDNLPSNFPEGNVSFKDLNSQFLKKQVEKGNTLQEIATDYAKATTLNDIFADESEEGKKYREDLANQQKETLKESYKQDNVKEKTKTIEEKQKKAEAFYKSFRPILEFDFDNLIKREDKDKPEKPKKTYEDRSYGITLMVMMLILLTIPYCFVTIVLSALNGLNAILDEINTFGKVARGIALTLLIITFVAILVYTTLLGIDKIFGTDIIPN